MSQIEINALERHELSTVARQFNMCVSYYMGPKTIRCRYSGRFVPAWYQRRMGWVDAEDRVVHPIYPTVVVPA